MFLLRTKFLRLRFSGRGIIWGDNVENDGFEIAWFIKRVKGLGGDSAFSPSFRGHLLVKISRHLEEHEHGVRLKSK